MHPRTLLNTMSSLALMACFICCAQKNENAAKTPSGSPMAETSQTPSAPTSLTCWAYSKDDDLIGMTLEMRGQQVSGKLTYTVYDRDRSSGNVTGMMRGDTIIGNYEYTTGSRKVIEEVVFLFRDNAFLEGTGPTTQRDGSTVFVDRSKLTFKNDRPLRSVPCHK